MLSATRESVDRAIECLTDDHKMLAEALLLRSGLPATVADPLADLNRAVELAPDNPDVWQARAMYYLQHGEVEKAVSDFNSLLDKDSDNMLTRLAVAEELIKVEQYDEALEAHQSGHREAADRRSPYTVAGAVVDTAGEAGRSGQGSG